MEHYENIGGQERLPKFIPSPILSFIQEAAPVRLPTTIERLYLDFDGFFASVEQQADRRLRGRPIGIVPFEGTDRTCVIAVRAKPRRWASRT